MNAKTPKPHRWPPEDVELLMRLRDEGTPYEDIAARVGRSASACERKYRYNGGTNVTTRKAWTRPEERRLMEMRRRGDPYADIANALQRSRSAVAKRYCILAYADDEPSSTPSTPDDDWLERFGGLIVRTRIRRGWTRRALAARARVNERSLRRLEQGEHLSTALLGRVLDVLDMDLGLVRRDA